MKAQEIHGLCLLVLLLAGVLAVTSNTHLPSQRTESASLSLDPPGRIQGSGVPVGVSWTGDGQRISNPSFETGSLLPWVQVQYNVAPGSAASVTTPGYDATHSAGLTVFSGNISTSSYLTLLSDFSPQPVGFSSSLRFRAAALVQQLTGASLFDRVEASLNLTTSIGHNRAIHYVFAYGSLPSNSTTDVYFIVGTAPTGQWIVIDRNVAADASAAFPSDYPSFDSASLVALTTFANTAPGAWNIDTHLKFWDTVGNHFWQTGEPVVYDTNADGIYETGEPVVGGCTDSMGNPVACPPPPNGASLTTDGKIKFVDTNGNGVWDQGEPIVYDTFGTGVVNYYDTIIIGPKPAVGTLLEKIIQNHTSSLFDRIELYSATAGSEWIKNDGFESGLTSWYENSSFTTSTITFLSGSHSAQGSITNGAIEMAQSIDGRPLIDSSTSFKASANIGVMTGTTSASGVDIWLGLVDSKYTPVSLYYVFKTGDGSVPNNRVDAIYRKVNGFGTLNQWLSVNASLSQDAAAFNLLGYTPPYTVEVVTVEVTAQAASSTTTVYFDNFSLHSSAHTEVLASAFYAVEGLNTTYVYTAQAIPQGSFHLEIPGGETVLNITSPEGTRLLSNDYTTSLVANCTISPCLSNPRAVDISSAAMFKHSPVGDWRVFATSTNTLSAVYAEDLTSHNAVSNINVGSIVNLVSLSKDPFGLPLAGVAVNFTIWNTNTGVQSGFWTGSTNSLGWYNVSSVALPPTGSSPGTYSLQAVVNSIYPGIRTFQVSVRYQVAVSMSVSSAQISQGQSVTISGRVTLTGTSSPGPGVNVTISYRQAGNSQWTVLGIVKTDGSGNFLSSWNPPQGQYEVMVTTGDSQTGSSQSSRAQLIVGPPEFPWLTLLVGMAAAVAVGLAAFIVYRRRKTRQPAVA